jgi:hypothetical protein
MLENPWDFKFSKSSLAFLRIHIWFTPLLEYAVEQYLWSDPLIAFSSLVSSKDRSLVDHLLEPAMYLCKDFYGILESNKWGVIQIDLDFKEYWKYFFDLRITDKTWLVEMCIWCNNIGIILVLHLKQKNDFEEFHPFLDWFEYKRVSQK